MESSNINERKIEHITPQEDFLATIKTDVLCDKEGCSRTFKSVPVLKFHQSQFHDHQKVVKKAKKDIEERFHCPVKDCIYHYSDAVFSRYFAKMQYLKQHYLKVHGSRSFPCGRCGKSFGAASFLRAHLRYCDLDLECSCGQTFVSITSLQTHVKRTSHEARVLALYRERLNEKKVKRNGEKFRVVPSSIHGPPSTPSAALLASPILPKPEPPHLIAAIALSELAFAGLKRVATVEVGVQTEQPGGKRPSRKSASPIRSREPQSQRRATAETQTRLTHLKARLRRRGTRRVSKCHMATGTPSPTPASPPPTYGEPLALDALYAAFIGKGSDCGKKACGGRRNSSGTQTGVGGTPFDALMASTDDECLPEDLFSGARCPKEVMEGALAMEEEDDLAPAPPTLDEDDCLMSMSPSGRLSPLPLPRRPPALCGRSSSIETQTEHDVFLSTPAQTDEDIVLTSTQTQTEGVGVGSPPAWVTSETQTCEAFSDIERYLCSTIHTQTAEHPSAELFPELSTFTADMQTQTRLEDALNTPPTPPTPPTLVTTHTQTSFLGVGEMTLP